MQPTKACPLGFLFFRCSAICLVAVLQINAVAAQCGTRVLHTNGTQMVGCTEVTVTSYGSIGFGYQCNTGPYLVGDDFTGGYTFTFSPPISGAVVNIHALDIDPTYIEEIVFSVDGAFYPISMPGEYNGCYSEAEIVPPGVIRGNTMTGYGGWDSVRIITPITTLNIENTHVLGNAGGAYVSLLICCTVCNTNAGNLNGGPLVLCNGAPANFPPSVQSILDGDDLLQYILFTNPNDTLGSIIATSNAPSFNYNPGTMMHGVTYYAAAIAGNNSGGNVDFNDDCLDISNGIEISWHPLPAVQLSVLNPDVCDGECTTIQAAFTGTPPFEITVNQPYGANVSFTFNSNTGTFEVCAPAGSPPGNVQVNAVSLNDAFCTCE